jgi:hypothetical protein
MKKYGVGHLLFDVFMTIITGGFWLLVIIIQYLRTH